MSWGTLANNQMVSFTDAQGGGFIRNNGQSEVTSNQCMTKSDAFTKYLLTASSSTNALAANQLMEKDYWVADTCNRSTMTVAFWYTNVYGWSGISSPQLGSMTNNSAVVADPAGAVFSTIHFNSTYGWLNFSLNTSSTTVVPTSWTSITIGSHTYPRTSFRVVNDGLYWQYSTTLQYDPIGTTIGAQVAVQLCNSAFPADTTAPTAPTSLIASSVTTTTLRLNWVASTDNIGVNYYLIYQNGILIATEEGNTTFRDVVGLTSGTTYNFTVYAKDGAGNISTVSNTANVTTTTTNSVTFSSFYSASGTSGTTNFSGTVTIVGTTATFKAYAAVRAGGPCSVSINVGGNTRTAFQSGIDTDNSTTFTLAPGTYSYSGSVTISSGYCQGGIQYSTQP